MSGTTMLHVLMAPEMRDAFQRACAEQGRFQDRVVAEYLETLVIAHEAGSGFLLSPQARESGATQMNPRIPKALAKRARTAAKRTKTKVAHWMRQAILNATEAGASRIERAA